MQNEKKKLIKNFKALIEDLLDHYEQYTDEEKARVQELFQKASELNVILDKYDIQLDFNWQEYFNTVSRYLGAG